MRSAGSPGRSVSAASVDGAGRAVTVWPASSKAVAVGLVEAFAKRDALRAGSAGADDRPDRGLVGGVEQRRAESGRGLLQGPDDRVAAAELGEPLAVVVAGEDPGHLGGDGLRVGVAVDREVELVAALSDLDADRGLEVVVEAERHPHDAVERPLVAVAEAEEGELLQREGSAGGDGRARGRRRRHPVIVAVGTDTDLGPGCPTRVRNHES